MFAILEPGRFNQRGKVPAVIDMEVSEQDHVQLGHLRSAFSKPEGTASARELMANATTGRATAHASLSLTIDQYIEEAGLFTDNASALLGL